MSAHDLTADSLPAIEIESGFDDRVRNGCGLLVAAQLGLMFAGAFACEPLFWSALACVIVTVACEQRA
jgi:hypothetical protein